MDQSVSITNESGPEERSPIDKAFSAFDESYHDIKAVVSAIGWISAECAGNESRGYPQESDSFGVIVGLATLVEKMMENALYGAGVNQRRTATMEASHG